MTERIRADMAEVSASLLENLEFFDEDSERYSAMVNALEKIERLRQQRIEIINQDDAAYRTARLKESEIECKQRELDLREREIELREREEIFKEEEAKRDEERHRNDGFRFAVDAAIRIAGIILPAIIGGTLLKNVLVFEETGSVTSSVGRNVLSRFVQKMF